MSDFEYAISQLDAKIKRAEVKKAGLEADKAKTLEANATLTQMMVDATEDRQAQKYWCISETDKNMRDKSDFEYAISQLDAKIKRAEVKKAGLEADKAKTLEANA